MKIYGRGSSTPSARRLVSDAVWDQHRFDHEEEEIPAHVAKARGSLIAFTEHTYSSYAAEESHRLIASVMDDVVNNLRRRVMLFAPPQMGKSELTSIRFPAYWLGHRPDDPVILTSYAASLAEHFSRRAREVIRSPEYQEIFPGTRIGGTTEAVNMWEIDGRRGFLRAAGVGGGIAGKGGLLGIIDDPVKDHQDAYSLASREAKWEWYRTTFLGRMWEQAAILLIMTRWHVDDLAGRILKSEPGEWDIIRIPALSETQKDRDEKNKIYGLKKGLPDPIGREEKDISLTPIRFSTKAYKGRRKKVGPSAWESEYQGSPMQAEGNMVKRSSFRIRPVAPPNLKICRYWDKAATGGGGAFTVGVLMGKDERERAEFTHWVLHVVRGQWGTYDRDETIKSTALSDKEKWGKKVMVRFEVEGGSSGKDVERDTIRMLSGYDVKGDSPTGSKEVRGVPFARQVEAGNVAMLAGEWNETYLDYIILFPNGGMDEFDASSGSFNSLAEDEKKKATATAR